MKIAFFGGGCFWCTEAVFKMLKGVISVTPGYSGGEKPNPTYEEVCGGTTGHAEVVRIEYDPSLVDYKTLLTIFFATHDPTTLNRQGNDVGTQYRSTILYSDDQQKIEAEKFIDDLNNFEAKAEDPEHGEGLPIITTVEPLTKFYPAENYHKDYFARNPGNPYCQVIINPKLEKVQKEFAELLNNSQH